MAASLETFFTDYAAAFDSFDADRITEFFLCPCLMVAGDSVVHFKTRSEIHRNVQDLVEHHRVSGYLKADVADVVIHSRSEGSVIAEVRWRVIKNNNSVLWEWNNIYNLIRSDGKWRILVSTTY